MKYAFCHCAVNLPAFSAFCAGGDVPAGLRLAVHHSSLQTVQGRHGGVCHLLPGRPQGRLAVRVPRHGGRSPLQCASCGGDGTQGAQLELIAAAEKSPAIQTLLRSI